MKQLAIKAENISKQYRLGEVGTGTLSHDLNRFWHKMRGNEDPYLKIGESNDRSSKGSSEYVWSLRDINFEIEKGDAMGIIGRNGAGKSTLLKLLSKVTKPTTGNFKINGRIASLLEVGTGFNPEMTGRENIYLNGAILGMRRNEITRKLAEIIDFSGVERYIDTPVKRYSSGMYVRLAFAVAAHLESEILIVDEVLAVGDAEFQKKCLGKMGDVSKGEGRTVLFVSHNMSAVKTLCNKGIILDKGGIVYNSDSASAIDYYFSLNSTNELKNVYKKEKIAGKDIQLLEATMNNQLKQPTEIFDISEDILINFTLNCETIIPNLYGYIVVKNTQEETFIESDTNDFLPNVLNNLTLGENKFSLKINKNTLPHGDYIVYLSFASSYSNNHTVEIPGDIVAFTVTDHTTQRGNARNAYTSYLLNWNKQNA